MNDFVESELLLIDGDSLLSDITNSTYLDWNHGGQYLQLVYQMERFLKKIEERGGTFKIIFFKDGEGIWLSKPSVLLARKIFITHMQSNTTHRLITQFWNWNSLKWRQFLKSLHPAYVLFVDTVPSGTWRQEEKDTVDLWFLSRLAHYLLEEINVAYIESTRHTVNKLFSDVTSAYFVKPELLQKVQICFHIILIFLSV